MRITKEQSQKLKELLSDGIDDISALQKATGATKRQIYRFKYNHAIPNDANLKLEKLINIKYSITCCDTEERGWQTNLAKKYNVSRQYISKIYKEMKNTSK